MIKPQKTFLLLLYVGLFLSLLQFLPDSIPLGGEQALKVPKISQIFTQKKVEYADVSETAKKIREELNKAKKEKNRKNPKKAQTDSNKTEYVPFVPDSLRLNPDLAIQYPDKKKADTLLFPFFRALKSLSANPNQLVRAIHYGDSQLEGDRITAFLRDKFQESFGGGGVGALSIVDRLHTKSTIFQSADANWLPYVMYGPKYRRSNSAFYGILGEYYKFPIVAEDNAQNQNTPFRLAKFKPTWSKASLYYSRLPQSNARQNDIKRVKVMFRNPEANCEVSIQAQGDSLKRVELKASKELQIVEYEVRKPFERVDIRFGASTHSPEVYGVALDPAKGVMFDNAPLRGSSGVEFTRVNKVHLKQQFEALNVRFLILQFGVNIVPNPLSDYGFYEKMFYEQLKFLKSLRPDLCILVVGVSDMSRRSANGFESYPNIEKIRDAQKKAAFRAGCAFWDLYQAMGGNNSMPSWVNEGLANRDYTHFTGKGAQIVSEMLYKALLTEYDRFHQLHY